MTHPADDMEHARTRKVVVVVVLVLVLVPLAVINVRMHRPGDLDTAAAQLRFLGRALDAGAGERMQKLFPEGFVFTWALYGLASAQLAESLRVDDPERPLHLAEAREALARVRSDRARSTFRSGMTPEHGAFYASWSLYLLAEYVRAVSVDAAPEELLDTLRDDATRFAEALEGSDTPFLPSYPLLTWPADTSVGVAALGIYDSVVAPEFTDVVARWIDRARVRLDPEVGALSHEAVPETGAAAGGVRGSSLALMSRVLVDADPDFARGQYELLREHFVDRRMLAPGVREYPRGVDGGGDVDSGPILLGYSGPALVVGAAAARAYGDERLAAVLFSVVEAAGVPWQWRGSRRYAGGLVPIGDAFIAWARTTPARAEATSWARITPWWWTLPVHLLSLLFAALIVWRASRVWPRQRLNGISVAATR